MSAEEERAAAETVRANAETSRVNAEKNRVSAETGRVNAENLREGNEDARKAAETARAGAEDDREAAEVSRVNAEKGRVTAESGRESAETSRVNTEKARAAAESERDEAEDGRVEAENARAAAESARVSAEEERAAAETARANAETLRVNAEKSRVTAEADRVNAENLREENEAARKAAETERADTESEREAAEVVRAKAEDARAAAEASRVSAESSRVSAETARANAETGRVNSEKSRTEAEADRAETENVREENENARQAAETARAEAEDNRETAETSRVSAEEGRVSAESGRASAETSRVNAEKARVTEESERAEAEDGRVEAESARAEAESDRASAEAARASEETARASAETSRVNAEKSRVTAETGRVNAEKARETEFDQKIQACEQATEAAQQVVEEAEQQGITGTVKYDKAQDLTDEQKAQARTNIGASATDNKVTQTNTSTKADYRLLFSNTANDTTETAGVRKSAKFLANPNTGEFYADGYRRQDITGKTLDLNALNLSAGAPHSMRYIEKTSEGAANISCGSGDIPVTGQPFLLDVELVRWASATDYVTRQIFVSIGQKNYEYIRWCTSGTWSAWTRRIFTDTTYSAATSSALGLVKLGSDTVQSVAAAAVTATASRTYAVQKNSAGQLVVNVPWSNTDTKNTAGSTNSSSKLFLIGATSQAASPQTFSHDTAYIGTDGHLYSNGKQVINLSDSQALTNKTYNGYTLAAACARGVFTLSAKGHLSYGTNNNYLPDKSAIVYWNGAHNANNSSNLEYCAKGMIVGTAESTVGSATRPVYLSNGKITACGNSLAVSITGNAASATKAKKDSAGNTISSYYAKKPTFENKAISTSAWSEVEDADPFTHKATVSFTASLSGDNTVLQLFNSDRDLFATYGFEMAECSGQSVTIYAVGKPSTSVTLKFMIYN